MYAQFFTDAFSVSLLVIIQFEIGPQLPARTEMFYNGIFAYIALLVEGSRKNELFRRQFIERALVGHDEMVISYILAHPLKEPRPFALRHI